MTIDIDARLKGLGLELPRLAVPSANYVPARRVGELLFVSGQVPNLNGKDIIVGRLGDTVTLEQGQEAARICAINLLAHVHTAIEGDWSCFVSVIRLGGFVNATPDFPDHPKVINGASDLMTAIFGDAGRHARASVGVSSLPRNVAVEIEGLFQLR